MSNDWEEFVADVSSTGRARSYMFEWIVPPVELLAFSADYKLLSTTLPGGDIEELVTYWQGTAYKCGGSRRFNDWTATIMCDNAGAMRSAFEAWMGMINFVGAPGAGAIGEIFGVSINSFHYGNPNLTSGGYYRPQTLRMLDDSGSSSHMIVLVDSWPKSVGDISLSRDSADFAQFDVTFAYNASYMIPLG